MLTETDQLKHSITITNTIRELNSQFDIREDIVYYSDGSIYQARTYIYNKFENAKKG